MSFEIKNLSIVVDGKNIVENISLNIKPGETHVVMGANGSGKSTLVNALMGHPKYEIKKGQIILDGTEITNRSPDFRVKKGLFLSMQFSPEISGVSLANLLRIAKKSVSGTAPNPFDFRSELAEKMEALSMDNSFASRDVNKGFSGGEKKRADILQMMTLDPKYVILDEPDSGLDVDSLKIVGNGIKKFQNGKKGLLIVTHYDRLLKYVEPDFVHIMSQGKIVQRGGKELATLIEKQGYGKA